MCLFDMAKVATSTEYVPKLLKEICEGGITLRVWAAKWAEIKCCRWEKEEKRWAFARNDIPLHHQITNNMAKNTASKKESAQTKTTAQKDGDKLSANQTEQEEGKQKAAKKPATKKGKKEPERPYNLQQDELDYHAREEIIVQLLGISFFTFSISKLAEVIDVDKDTLLRYKKAGAKRKADRINDVWFQIKDIFGLSTADMKSFGKTIVASQFLYDEAKKWVKEQLRNEGGKDAEKESLRALCFEWVTALLKNEYPYKKDKEPISDWWVQMQGLMRADAGTYFNTLAAFYLRCNDKLVLQGRSKEHVAEVRALFENLQRELYNNGFKWVKPSSLADERSRQKQGEEAIESYFDLLLERHSFCPMVNVTYGGLLLRATIDAQLRMRIKSVGDNLVVGNLTWWVEPGTIPTDKDARIWLLIEPTTGEDNQLSTPLYQLLEYQPHGFGPSGFSYPKLKRIHQLTFFRLKQRMHCYTFEHSKEAVAGNYSEWEWRLSEDRKNLFLSPLDEGHVPSEEMMKHGTLPSHLRQLSTKDDDHVMWLKTITGLHINNIINDRQKFIYDRFKMEPIDKRECQVDNVIIDRYQMRIEYRGTRWNGEISIRFSDKDNERFRCLSPMDEVFPVMIDLGNGGNKILGFHFPKVGTIYE